MSISIQCFRTSIHHQHDLNKGNDKEPHKQCGLCKDHRSHCSFHIVRLSEIDIVQGMPYVCLKHEQM